MLKKGSQFNSILYYFSFYVPFGAVCPLLSQYLDSIGLSGTEVGTITACSTLGAAIGGLLLGRGFSNSKNKKRFLIFTAFMCGVMDLICKFAYSFLPFLILYMTLYFFQEPLHSLSDSMITQNGENFPIIRGFGAIGYAVASFFTGLVCEYLGLDKGFYIASLFYFISILFLSRTNEPKNFVQSKTEKVRFIYLLKSKKFISLLICAVFFMGIVMANNTYFGYLYINGGGSISGIGLAFLLMAGSEAVIMSFIPLLEKKLSIEKIIPIGVFFEILRFGFYAFGPSSKWLLATFFLQGLMNGVLLVEFVKYFTKVVEPKYASLSVATFNAVGVNFSTILLNLFSGIILDTFDISTVYLTFAIVASTGLMLYILFGLHRTETVHSEI